MNETTKPKATNHLIFTHEDIRWLIQYLDDDALPGLLDESDVSDNLKNAVREEIEDRQED